METDTLDNVRTFLAKELCQDKRLLKFPYHSNNITIREAVGESKFNCNTSITYEKLSKPEACECTREELVKIIRELFKQKVIVEQNRLLSNAYRNHLHDCIFTVDGVDYKASLMLLALQSFPHGLVYCLLASTTIDSVEKHSRAIHIDFNDRLFAQFDKKHLHESLDFIIKQSYTVSEEEFDIIAIQALLALCEYLGLQYTNAIKCVIEDDYYQEFIKPETMTLH